MNEVLERVAAAMESHWVVAGGREWEIYTNRTGASPTLIDSYAAHRDARAACRELNARAAVEALLPASSAMCEAGGGIKSGGHFVGVFDAERILEAILAEVLRP